MIFEHPPKIYDFLLGNENFQIFGISNEISITALGRNTSVKNINKKLVKEHLTKLFLEARASLDSGPSVTQSLSHSVCHSQLGEVKVFKFF
jgi:hypothetical protein